MSGDALSKGTSSQDMERRRSSRTRSKLYSEILGAGGRQVAGRESIE
jgi:hypothetical protein